MKAQQEEEELRQGAWGWGTRSPRTAPAGLGALPVPPASAPNTARRSPRVGGGLRPPSAGTARASTAAGPTSNPNPRSGQGPGVRVGAGPDGGKEGARWADPRPYTTGAINQKPSQRQAQGRGQGRGGKGTGDEDGGRREGSRPPRPSSASKTTEGAEPKAHKPDRPSSASASDPASPPKGKQKLQKQQKQQQHHHNALPADWMPEAEREAIIKHHMRLKWRIHHQHLMDKMGMDSTGRVKTK